MKLIREEGKLSLQGSIRKVDKAAKRLWTTAISCLERTSVKL